MSTHPELPLRYLGEQEAASYTRLSRRTLQKYRVSGDGPLFIKRGTRIVYPLESLDEWMQAGRRASTSDPGAALRRP